MMANLGPSIPHAELTLSHDRAKTRSAELFNDALTAFEKEIEVCREKSLAIIDECNRVKLLQSGVPESINLLMRDVVERLDQRVKRVYETTMSEFVAMLRARYGERIGALRRAQMLRSVTSKAVIGQCMFAVTVTTVGLLLARQFNLGDTVVVVVVVVGILLLGLAVRTGLSSATSAMKPLVQPHLVLEQKSIVALAGYKPSQIDKQSSEKYRPMGLYGYTVGTGISESIKMGSFSPSVRGLLVIATVEFVPVIWEFITGNKKKELKKALTEQTNKTIDDLKRQLTTKVRQMKLECDKHIDSSHYLWPNYYEEICKGSSAVSRRV